VYWVSKGGGFLQGTENPLDCDRLVVGEASMVDVLLMNALLKPGAGRSSRTRDQRRGSVAVGRPRSCPGRYHRERSRWAAKSQIIVNVHRIDEGVIPNLRKLESLFSLADVAGARRFLERALEKGSGRAAFLLAETFSGRFLQSLQIFYSVCADMDKPRQIYEAGAMAGIEQAMETQEALESAQRR
jgi:hypothetical protein